MERKGNFFKKTEGATAITIAICLFVLIGMASLAIDVGQLYTVRNELQNVADAAALAGVGQLVQNSGGQAVRDSALATQAAMQVAQTQSQLQGQPTVADGARNDLTLRFGLWDIYSGNPATSWTDLGTTCASTSNANAMRVTIIRSGDTVFGPVSNIFAKIFGADTSTVSASATAYLGFTNQVQTGSIQVPLALPNNVLTAAAGKPGWFASLFGPKDAVASTTKTFKFRDTGGSKVPNNVPTSPAAGVDANQAYFYTAGANDSVPGTIKDILTKVYTPNYTSSNPVYMDDLKLRQQIYPRSEYPWGRSNQGPIFQKLKAAYDYKQGKYDAQLKYQNPAGKWRTTLVVHGPLTVSSLTGKSGWLFLSRLLGFGPTPAFACTTMNPPTVSVYGFVNVDITGVTYNSTSSDDCNTYTFPKTINGKTYTSVKDCLNNLPTSTWNSNTVTVTNVVDASTVSPPGSLSGGPSNNTINTNAPPNVGAIATVPRLVQ